MTEILHFASRRQHEIDAAGAVLVRPDGYVAWRNRSGSHDRARSLQATLGGARGRTPVKPTA